MPPIVNKWNQNHRNIISQQTNRNEIRYNLFFDENGSECANQRINDSLLLLLYVKRNVIFGIKTKQARKLPQRIMPKGIARFEIAYFIQLSINIYFF